MNFVGIDLFCGAGGLSLGAVEAGIRVALAVDSDSHAALTYRHNLPVGEFLLGDICQIPSSYFSEIARKAGVSIVFGGSPCQGFSHSNQRTRNTRNRGNWLYLEFLRVVEACQPDWVVFENVKGIIDTEGGVFLADLLKKLANLDYLVSSGVLNAADYGVPQCRERLFVLGSRTHPVPLSPTSSNRRVTVEDAISDLPSLENGANINRLPYRCPPRSEYSRCMRGTLETSPNHLVTKSADCVIERYHHVPQGGNWTDIPLHLLHNYQQKDLDLHTGLYRRLQLEKPSTVIGNYRKNMLIHPLEPRGLSVREAARLQSFPDWYEFQESIGFQQQQVGNAVPPLLAKAVFTALVDASNWL